jgi:hypothetical protein
MDTASLRPTCRLASSESSRRNRGAAHRDATGNRIGPHLCGGPVRPGSSVGRRRSELSHYGGGTGGRARSPQGSDLGIGIDIFQARFAAGGESVGLDMQASPYRLNSILLKSRAALIAPYIRVESMVG